MNVHIGKLTLPGMLLAIFLGVVPGLAQAELVVIGNPDLGVNRITAEQAMKVWLAKLRKLPGTGRLVVVDQVDGSPAYNQFYAKVVKKTRGHLKAYWAKIAFTGKGFPPEQLEDDAAVLEWVRSTPNGLGYVDSAAVDGSVKVLLTIN